METILLLRKPNLPAVPITFRIYDDFVTGGVSGEMYLLEEKGRLFPLSWIMTFYRFPQVEVKSLFYLKGRRQDLFEAIEYYSPEQLKQEVIA